MNEEQTASASVFAQLANLFVAPGQALDYADRRPKMLWLPFGVTLLGNALLSFWIAFTMSLPGWRAMMMQIVARTHPEAAGRFAHAGRGYLIIGAVGGIVVIAVVELVYALYLFMADKLFSADSRSYGRWFSFTAWTWLPIVLAYVAGMIAWGLSGHGASLTPGDVTSLNALFLHLKPGSPYFRLAQFSVLQFWVIGLVTYGLRRWCGHGAGKALAIALVPYVLVYGVTFLV